MYVLKPFQKAVLDHFEENGRFQHVLCLAPTGSGKSLIYQKLAQRKGHRMLLVTPLIALAHQQSSQLKSLGISVFFGLEGSLEAPCSKSESGVWIVSPESLQSIRRREAVISWKPNFLVVDECHCIWEWGAEGFRPIFSQVLEWGDLFSIPKSLWLTATLSEKYQKLLKNRFEPHWFQVGFFQLPSSLFLWIQKISFSDRMSFLANFLLNQKGPGLLFVLTRSMAQRLSRFLEPLARMQGFKKVAFYHAGLSVEEKRNLENQIREKKIDWIVATSAFGMGMDYAHLSFVVLWQLPPTVLSLVQMVGRVARGGEHTQQVALIFWEEEDFELLHWTVKGAPQKAQDLLELRRVLEQSGCFSQSLNQFFGVYSEKVPCGRCNDCQPPAFNI